MTVAMTRCCECISRWTLPPGEVDPWNIDGNIENDTQRSDHAALNYNIQSGSTWGELLQHIDSVAPHRFSLQCISALDELEDLVISCAHGNPNSREPRSFTAFSMMEIRRLLKYLGDFLHGDLKILWHPYY